MADTRDPKPGTVLVVPPRRDRGEWTSFGAAQAAAWPSDLETGP
jgi:hypothetical protein